MLRRSTRERQFSQIYLSCEYVMISDIVEPKYYLETISNVDKEKMVEGHARKVEFLA